MRMLHSLATLFTSLAVAKAATGIAFVNPEPAAATSGNRNYQLNPSYPLGSSLLISWTSPANSVSMVLYQERPNDEFEYVFINSVNITSFRWNIGTRKDLKNGAVFFFQIFVTGETSPSATSRYFNLTRSSDEDDEEDSTSSSSRTSSTLSTSMTISLTSAASTSTRASADSVMTSATSSPSASGTAAPAPTGNANSGTSGTTIGIAVAIPIAIVLICAIAFFLWRRNRKAKDALAASQGQDYTNNVPPNTDNKYTPPGDGSYAPNAMQEQNGGGYYKPQHDGTTEMFTPGAETAIGTPRSELASMAPSAVGGANGGVGNGSVSAASEMYTPPPAGAVQPVAGHGNAGGEVHEMSGVRYT